MRLSFNRLNFQVISIVASSVALSACMRVEGPPGKSGYELQSDIVYCGRNSRNSDSYANCLVNRGDTIIYADGSRREPEVFRPQVLPQYQQPRPTVSAPEVTAVPQVPSPQSRSEQRGFGFSVDQSNKLTSSLSSKTVMSDLLKFGGKEVISSLQSCKTRKPSDTEPFEKCFSRQWFGRMSVDMGEESIKYVICNNPQILKVIPDLRDYMVYIVTIAGCEGISTN